jgi:hypothetical protein
VCKLARPKKQKENTVTIHLNLSPEAIALLNKLAGGERRKSEYIERIIPVLYEATEIGKQQQTQAMAEALAAALTKGTPRE